MSRPRFLRDETSPGLLRSAESLFSRGAARIRRGRAAVLLAHRTLGDATFATLHPKAAEHPERTGDRANGQ
jgi:hypothetical protein